MLEQQSIEAGIAQFEAELPDLRRAFASEVDRIYASVVDRGMLHSGITVGQIDDAIRREYKTRAQRVWDILHALVPVTTVGTSDDRAQLESLIAQAVDRSTSDLETQHGKADQLMGDAARAKPLADMREEALTQINAVIGVEMAKLANAATAAPPTGPATRADGRGLTIFLGSSSAAKSQAKAIAAALTRPGLEFLPWWDAFTPGNTLLQELDVIRERVDGALLLFAPESQTTIRGNEVQIPNLNVLFEFGYFYGHFGKNRVGMLKYGEFYLPSDLGGYIDITGSKSFRRGRVVQVGKRTTNEFNRWVTGL